MLNKKNIKYKIINQENLNNYSKVAVITPVYNAEKYLNNTIDSVIRQNIGFTNIQFILVDDCSKDKSRDILLKYAELYENITVVLLDENTGTPAEPRNLGIKLSNSEYITFLDADDWFSVNALKCLSEILDETNDDYVVGKTIQMESESSKVIGKHESCLERRSVSPYSIKHIFRHLGPRARMIRSKLIKENNILYPTMRFAEDKQFFMDVLLHCNTISTTKNIIYYLNRLDENNESLTKQTDIMEKMDTNIKVINYIVDKNLEDYKEQQILNRLYEFDCITRLFYRQHFLKNENKQEYYDKFKQALEVTKELRYDIGEYLYDPINKAIYNLFINNKFEDIVKLIKYNKNEKERNIVIKDNKPYIVAEFLDDNYKFIRLPMKAYFRCGYNIEDKFILEIDVYGDFVKQIQNLVIQKRDKFYNEEENDFILFDIKENNNGRIKIELGVEELLKINSGSYKVYLRYNNYEELYISYLEDNKIIENNKILEFYNTINNNVGFRTKYTNT